MPTPEPPESVSPTPRARGRLASIADAATGAWYACPFRWQILIAITLLTLLTGAIGGILAVFDSRTRAAVEMRSNVELWRHHIAAQAREIDGPADLAPFSWRLAHEMAQVRHVSIRVVDAEGNPLAEPQNSHAVEAHHDREAAPQWFIDLAKPATEVQSVPITAQGKRLGTVQIEGEPDDEIAEAWELLVQMSVLWLGGTALMMLGLYFVLGFVLDPLVTLAEGMRELEDGHYGLRIEPPKVRELSAIVTSFNTLAQALDQANAENSRLYRQLIAVQEDERRQISRDLHDEFGPCLFGITAGTGAIERHARALPEPQAAPILSCVNDIALVSDRLKSLTRSLLNRLRPVALGRVTLTELISDLIVTFKRRHPDTHFKSDFADLPTSFGEDIDLTLYRCVQEGLTNAMRHGRPSLVSVALAVEQTPSAAQVRLRIGDDGIGISDSAAVGFGLSGMRERVRAQSGTLVIEPTSGSGTELLVTLPVRSSDNAKPEAPTHTDR
ncbi:LapD/MoxY N-terminal periplasmic domain-containing protein [Hyphomicrobium sp.]|uniref:LapD/MoxY N-terminal periplasmic domain-containing protein n=1 Tax=Hyphomicrobium sp. TaxID=82 RepID=UPI0025B81E33|nr:LapD/MoxY N-terminal periplasmic domain-containing protein [Hyphomicrobium sp.]MCC7251665.1 HAMP domain-containing protein [Hyphomicrobium sp.]